LEDIDADGNNNQNTENQTELQEVKILGTSTFEPYKDYEPSGSIRIVELIG